MNLIVSYEYDSWGRLVSQEPATETVGNLNPFRYRGYCYDAETGLYYLGSRYYDPVVGRFINTDEIVSGVGGDIKGYNLYAYCMNDPINMSDEDGNWPKWAKKVAIGVAVIATAAIVTVATAGAASGTLLAVHCFAAGALKGAIVGAAVGAATGAATGGKNSKVCFVAGTSVLTAIGYVLIEDIREGDKVWSENPETGEKELKEVVQTFVNETDELVHVRVNGEEIIATPEHPFYVPKKGWIGAIDLRAGDILVLQSGEYVVVELIQHEILEFPVKVYNFEVEDFHTYYVGNSSVLVHNRCVVKQNGVKIEVRTSNEHGLPHGPVSGNGPNTTVGLNQMPMKNHPDFSKKQLKVIQDNWEVIKNGIIELFPKR